MSFREVVGQDGAVRALEEQLRRFDGAGSTIIAGPEGVGRFLLAHRAAVAILGDARLVEAFTHPDLQVLDADAGLEGERGIDGVRAAAEALQRRPARGPRQVLLVRDADRLSLEAHNALLKTLEEPPAEAAIFLVAEDPAHLPLTVVSRCRLVRARALDAGETAAVLERHGVPASGAADAEGSPGRALYHARMGVGEDASRLLRILEQRDAAAFAAVEALVRRRKDEESKEQRRRLAEVLRVAAARLRRDLPASEAALRRVVDALGSILRNANPGIVFTDLALTPWKTSP